MLRTDASHALGYGHLARVAGLAHAVRVAGAQPVVLLSGDLEMVGTWCAAQGLAAQLGTWDAAEVRHVVARTAAAVVVLDGPVVVRNLAPALLGDSGLAVVAVDDVGVIDLPVEAVVNHNHGAERLTGNYPLARQLLLGRSYLILRRDILMHRQGACMPGRHRRLRVVITFGGSDPVGATARALTLVPAAPALDLVVLCGPGFRDHAGLRHGLDHAHAAGHHAEVVSATATPADVFVAADAAICAAGGTLNELAYLGCPAAAYAIAADQLASARAQADAGLVVGGDAWSSVGDDAVRAQLATFLSDAALRGRIREAALATADGCGAARIVAHLLA